MAHKLDEPWNSSKTAVTEKDGRGSTSFAANYAGIANVSSLRTRNLQSPMTPLWSGAAALARAIGILLSTNLVTAACSSESTPSEIEQVSTANPEAPEQPICDGSDQLRLRFFYEPALSREPPGNAVLLELGYSSIGIDGHCRYWINGGWANGKVDEHLPWKTGELPASLAAELDAAINLSTLDTLECDGFTTYSHKNYYTIRSQYSRRRCEVGLDDTKFYEVYRILDSRALQLYDAAVPVDGAIRMLATSSGWPFDTYEWPVELDPFLRVDSSSELLPGHSQLVTDPEAARLLRQLRNRFIADATAPEASHNTSDGIPLSVGTSGSKFNIELFVRDALPYELANGLWPWSDP